MEKPFFAYIHIQEHIERFIYSNVSKGIFPTIMSAVIFLGIIFESAVSYFFSAECNSVKSVSFNITTWWWFKDV